MRIGARARTLLGGPAPHPHPATPPASPPREGGPRMEPRLDRTARRGRPQHPRRGGAHHSLCSPMANPERRPVPGGGFHHQPAARGAWRHRWQPPKLPFTAATAGRRSSRDTPSDTVHLRAPRAAAPRCLAWIARPLSSPIPLISPLAEPPMPSDPAPPQQRTEPP